MDSWSGGEKWRRTRLKKRKINAMDRSEQRHRRRMGRMREMAMRE